MERKKRNKIRQSTVDQLVKERQSVTIEAICQLSQRLDPQGKGIKKAGILGNEEAYAYYRQYRASQRSPSRRTVHQPVTALHRLPPDPHRDLQQVRRRYLRARKADLVARLLFVEQGCL